MFPNVEFLRALEYWATEKPEYQYIGHGDTRDVQCTYVHNGEPDCLIGHALHSAGVDIDALAAFDDGWDDSGAQHVLTFLGAHPSVAHFAEAVQRLQDRGVPWGDAYARAKEKTATPQQMAAGMGES